MRIPDEPENELKSAIKSTKEYFVLAGLFSAAVNLLYLVPIIYMLQVYDRVVSSGSYATLYMLTILMIALLSAQGAFEWVRSSILVGASNRLEKTLRPRVSEATFKRSFLTGIASSQPFNDLQQLRQFLTGQGLFAFLDAPWTPIYIIIMFLFHPWFGVAAILATIVMIFLAIWNDRSTKTKLRKANNKAAATYTQIGFTLQNAEVTDAMGMTANLRKQQDKSLDEVLLLQAEASKSAGVISSISKTFRMVMQSLLIGLGALLVLRQDLSPGMMIAGSLLLGRALAPIDMLVAHWKAFTIAQNQYVGLENLLQAIPKDTERMTLPEPTGSLVAENLTVVPPGSQKPVLGNVNIRLEPGDILGVVGPSASGKSCLARALLGIWPAAAGKVRLDGADIFTWDRDEIGPHVGYLPQDIELFEGTISENICRFSDIASEKIVEAATLAGIHDLILTFENGYDTEISADASQLSGGQRQRIGLARAVYDNPKLIVLDEPNSNLDDQGEKALRAAIEVMSKSGSTIVVISHRTSLLKCVSKILVLNNGRPIKYGARDEVLTELAGVRTVPAVAS
jgi:ATP-binding cassette subfamily C protein EexD